ncbi:helix-turn-helix transcriptional regulator [Pusillimonas sp. ANT_WB101]|nr:helix-turn-helix transcriptional regulator [Pusillimonas sp. ANT_WB101]
MSQKRLADMLGSTEQTVSLWERHGRMPVGYDRLMRAFYLGFLDGNVKLRDMVDRLVNLDRPYRDEKAVFEDTDIGWKIVA